MRPIYLVCALGKNAVIGRNNQLPWRLPKDLALFRQRTIGQAVLMGRKTYEALPKSYQPLPDRFNIVLTRNKEYSPPSLTSDQGLVVHSIHEARKVAAARNYKSIYVIGGSAVYQATLPYADALFLTHVDASPEGDAFFPSFNKDEWHTNLLFQQPIDRRHVYSFSLCHYVRKHK